MSEQRHWMKTSVIALALWVAAATQVWAQISVVVPNANASFTPGNADNRFPFLVAGGQRYQQVFNSSEFSAFGGPQLISQMSLRNGLQFSQPFTANIASIQISLSTISVGADGLSPTFASNIGGNNTQVYNGALTLSSTNGPGPGNTHVFDIVINFQTPFLYNPSAGNLLLDVQNNSGADAFVGTNFFDALNTPGDPVSRVFGTEGVPAATTGTPDSWGLIAQFTTASAVPEPTSLALMGVSGLAVLGYVRYRRKSALRAR